MKTNPSFLEVLSELKPREREDALWLLSAFRACSRAQVLLDAQGKMATAELARFRAAWARRKKGEPLQYVAGEAPFYGRDFRVSRDVLIPRPETERLVEICLGLLRERPDGRVLDVGTGSGCIAITLKAELPSLRVTGTDISAKALKVAERNAARLGAEVAWRKANLVPASLREEEVPFLLVSNPPYLSWTKDYIAPDVRKFEPRIALEPATREKVSGVKDRAAWCAERILRRSAEILPRYTALELSPRVAAALERRWRGHSRAERVWREADLAGRKRFLLIAWKIPENREEHTRAPGGDGGRTDG